MEKLSNASVYLKKCVQLQTEEERAIRRGGNEEDERAT